MDGPSLHLPTEILTSPASVQKRRKSPGSADKTKTQKSPKSLPQFKKLPLEVQDMIWKHTLDLDAPNVHGVELRRIETPSPGVEMVQDMLWNTHSGEIRTPIYPKPDALRETCRRSRAAAERALRQWKAEQPYELNSDRTYVATEQVDLSRDLFVLSNQLEGDVAEGDEIPGVKYVGVTWEGMWDVHIVQKMDKVVELFPDLVCMYLVVTPVWATHPNLGEWDDWEMAVLHAYEQAHDETATLKTDHEFLCNDMIYQEVSLERLRQTPGLHEPLSYINDFHKALESRREEAEEKGEGEHVHKPAVRVMAWSQARRVRSRFP